MKAYLYNITKSEEIFFTHAIYELNKTLTNYYENIKKIEPASKLDEYYILTRYPNGLPGGVPSRFFKDEKEAQEAMDLANLVIEFVKDKIGLVNLE